MPKLVEPLSVSYMSLLVPIPSIKDITPSGPSICLPHIGISKDFDLYSRSLF